MLSLFCILSEKVVQFESLHVSVLFFQHTYQRDYLFPIVYCCLPFHRIIDHRSMGLFLGYSIPLIFVSVSCTSTLLITVALQQSLKSGRLIPPVPFFFIKIALEPIIQSKVSQKEKHQYSILTHIYGIQKDGNNNPVYETAKETLMYRTVFWTLWERERVR